VVPALGSALDKAGEGGRVGGGVLWFFGLGSGQIGAPGDFVGFDGGAEAFDVVEDGFDAGGGEIGITRQ